ncbi:hypothetical protein ACTVZO_02720 [Streptomyces sp. IBSNAI002]|uniref:hypothetical protein n=1 Tax=Streptomyces sp. IBSNAI002 TaxID=3457500 RepID=UPI003FD697E1
MQRDDEQRSDEQRLTTEQLAHPGGGGQPPLYPGEATAGDVREEDRDEMRREADVTDAEETAYGETAYGETAYGEGTAGERSASVPAETAADESLLPAQEAEGYQKTWGEIQARFVDDPQGAVRDADGLVAEVMQTLAATFSDHKRDLESQWQQGEQVATEDLRLALQRYRSFFGRLLRT